MASNTGSRCEANSCVDVKTTEDGGVIVFSTTPGVVDRVPYTAAEWAQFITDVKAGQWDHTVTRVAATV